LADPEIPKRLLQLDDITRGDHYFIADDDVCFHLWEYVKAGNVKEHPTNQLIQNLKIPMSAQQNIYRWRYKGLAINFAAAALSQVVPQDFFQHFTWIPIPPSAPKGTPEHDSRLCTVLRTVWPRIPDIRELVVQNVARTSKEKGLQPCDRARDFQIDESLTDPAPTHAILFDDVLTTGCHFKAMQTVLQQRFPGIFIAGLFLARVIRPDEPSAADLADFQSLLQGWLNRDS